jgi:hypothetical protein
MKEEAKSSLKTVIVAIIVMAAVFFGMYKMDAANTAAHSHNGGSPHTH